MAATTGSQIGINANDGVQLRSAVMKKLILAAVAASMVATPVLAAPMQNYGPQRNHRVVQHQPPAPQYRNWQRGQRFDARYARNYRQIDWRTHRGLKAPPRGYHYVQSGNDAVLVALGTGIVAAIFANALR
jgi:Ni/Co efflux regulator RcnB